MPGQVRDNSASKMLASLGQVGAILNKREEVKAEAQAVQDAANGVKNDSPYEVYNRVWEQQSGLAAVSDFKRTANQWFEQTGQHLDDAEYAIESTKMQNKFMEGKSANWMKGMIAGGGMDVTDKMDMLFDDKLRTEKGLENASNVSKRFELYTTKPNVTGADLRADLDNEHTMGQKFFMSRPQGSLAAYQTVHDAVMAGTLDKKVFVDFMYAPSADGKIRLVDTALGDKFRSDMRTINGATSTLKRDKLFGELTKKYTNPVTGDLNTTGVYQDALAMLEKGEIDGDEYAWVTKQTNTEAGRISSDRKAERSAATEDLSNKYFDMVSKQASLAELEKFAGSVPFHAKATVGKIHQAQINAMESKEDRIERKGRQKLADEQAKIVADRATVKFENYVADRGAKETEEAKTARIDSNQNKAYIDMFRGRKSMAEAVGAMQDADLDKAFISGVINLEKIMKSTTLDDTQRQGALDLINGKRTIDQVLEGLPKGTKLTVISGLRSLDKAIEKDLITKEQEQAFRDFGDGKFKSIDEALGVLSDKANTRAVRGQFNQLDKDQKKTLVSQYQNAMITGMLTSDNPDWREAIKTVPNNLITPAVIETARTLQASLGAEQKDELTRGLELIKKSFNSASRSGGVPSPAESRLISAMQQALIYKVRDTAGTDEPFDVGAELLLANKPGSWFYDNVTAKVVPMRESIKETVSLIRGDAQKEAQNRINQGSADVDPRDMMILDDSGADFGTWKTEFDKGAKNQGYNYDEVRAFVFGIGKADGLTMTDEDIMLELATPDGRAYWDGLFNKSKGAE